MKVKWVSRTTKLVDLLLAAVHFVVLLSAATLAQDSLPAQNPPIQSFQIRIDRPTYIGLPVWINANLPPGQLEVHYPYGESPGFFGPNQIEVKCNGQPLSPRPYKASPSLTGGILGGSIAPPNSPRNRVPLHLQYLLEQPGNCSVRWTIFRYELATQRLVQKAIAQSNWLTFQVRRSTEEQRKKWLDSQLAKAPTDPGVIVGDYLPSLLAAVPDLRVLRAVTDQLYSSHQVVNSIALSSVEYFPGSEVAREVLNLLHRRGFSDAMAYLVSWHEPLFRDFAKELVGICVRQLGTARGAETAAALKALGFMLHLNGSHWPKDLALTEWADDQVLSMSLNIIAGGDASATHELAIYLGGVRTECARELLWKISQSPAADHEQALIALTWIKDPRDLPRIGELLLEPGDPDSYGRDRSSLPYSLMQAYGTARYRTSQWH